MRNRIRRTEVVQLGTRTRIRDPRGRLSLGYVAPEGKQYIVRQAGTADRFVPTLDGGIDVLCARIPIAYGTGLATMGIDHDARG